MWAGLEPEDAHPVEKESNRSAKDAIEYMGVAVKNWLSKRQNPVNQEYIRPGAERAHGIFHLPCSAPELRGPSHLSRAPSRRALLLRALVPIMLPLWPGCPSNAPYSPDQAVLPALDSAEPAPRDSATPFIADTSQGGALSPERLASPSPVFSVQRGLFYEPFSLSVTSPLAGAVVLVTTDGTDPRGDGGQHPDDPISITTTTTVSATICLSPGTCTDPVTHSFIFPQLVPDQGAPPDYPTWWWADEPTGGFPADYEMDPEITGNPLDEDLVPRALAALPSLSLVMDPWDLFGADGIYEWPLEEGPEWERPVSLEWIPVDGSESHQLNAGVRIHGGASRYPYKSPKKSFRLLFKSIYGPSRMCYPLFDDGDVSCFDTLVLRARYNLSWIHMYSSQRGNALYLRDQFARESQLAMGQPSCHGRHVHLYLNGLYWGVYILHERPDASFMVSYLDQGSQDEDWDVLVVGEAVEGDRKAWDKMMQIAGAGLASDEAYQRIQQYLDVENLADYMILNFFLGNNDWPGNNWYAAREHRDGAGFMFFSWDAENIFRELDQDITSVDSADSPASLYRSLLDNQQFRVLLAQRIQAHFTAGGALSAQAVLSRFQELADQVQPAIAAESARWGDYRRDVSPYGSEPFLLYTLQDNWLPERERLQDDYLPYRSDVVLEQFRQAGLYPSP